MHACVVGGSTGPGGECTFDADASWLKGGVWGARRGNADKGLYCTAAAVAKARRRRAGAASCTNRGRFSTGCRPRAMAAVATRSRRRATAGSSIGAYSAQAETTMLATGGEDTGTWKVF